MTDHGFLLYKETVGANSEKDNGTPLQYSCLENPLGRGVW